MGFSIFIIPVKRYWSLYVSSAIEIIELLNIKLYY